MTTARLPFLALTPGEDAAEVGAAIDRVLARGWFVLGPEGEAFEAEFARASGAAHAIGTGNGTDALALIFRALGVGAGDEVVVPALTAAYTALAVTMVGARPVFADVEDGRLTLDPASCRARLTARTRAIVPVHLFGQAADLPALAAVASAAGVPLVEDCCQAHLATCQGVPVGTVGVAGAFSFYPTKNLGGVGDGGAVITGRADLAARIRRLRNGGQVTRYEHQEAGINSRLDELQAAVLRVRLTHLPAWTARRRALAARYRHGLDGCGAVPVPQRDAGHVYHLFPVRHPSRDALRAHLDAAGIETLIHYPIPLDAQQAFAQFGPAPCPVAARAASELLSLPLHPALGEHDVDRVTGAIRTAGGALPA
ncbi:MAG: DegT/DnrJ/EryC1/StrS family aminotransferase [Alphaproteobacteria bacterium]